MLLIWEHLLTIAGFLLAVTLISRILRENRRPGGGAMAWLMAILLIPYIGVPLYLVFGGRKIQRRMRHKTDLYGAGAADASPVTTCGAERVLLQAGMPPTRRGNEAHLHFSGESAYAELMDLIAGARHSIHATTFILGRDEVGRSIIDALAEKAAEGVKVRLLLDSLGCLRTGGRFSAPLRNAGGSVARFLPVLPTQRKWSANLRNHRKIVIVDNEAAMVGGMNFATSFMGPRPDPARFVDSAVFLRGPAAGDVAAVFAGDWRYTTDEDLPHPAPEPAGQATTQVAASGPDVPDDALHDALITAMMEARERIWVVTPYFVPDDAMLEVLAIQARMGREVHVILPKRSNHRITDFARGPAVRQLVRAGAAVFAYPDRMVHAKVMLFDDAIAITGSPNLDMRSMYFNFEIALFHYSRAEIDSIATWIASLAAEAARIDDRPPGRLRGWAEGLSVLSAPLL